MKDPKEILAEMTLEEKAAICDGKDFWHLKGMEKYDIPEIMVCDGPHGLRKKNYSQKGLSLSKSVPAICYPTAAGTAASWDPELIYKMGEALGRKCQYEKVGVLLGPGINMKRSPLCGRNFEYFSEDPVLAGEMAAGLIDGVQSQGIGTSIKHYAVNSQETRRMVVDEVVDERALREIYLRGFEIAIKKSKPWTVMCSYNKINGTHGSENYHTQTEILRNEWGWDGVVVSDWGAVNDRVEGVKTGNDLEMPSSSGSGTKKIIEAVKSGKLSEADLDKAALNVLNLIKKCADGAKKDYKYDEHQDEKLARKISAATMVLMKNEDNILPLDKSKKIAVIGALAKEPRYQGAGSSHIVPTELEDAYTELKNLGVNFEYAQGYELTNKKASKNPAHIAEAAALAAKVDTVVLFIGLTDEYEAEGFDRTDMKLPQAHNQLVEAVAKVNKNIVIVLAGGSPVEMPWNDEVKAVLNSYLGGQASGGAVADILTGAVNPSGKLPETYPIKYEDTPAVNNFPGNPASVEHREGIYIGYRYYEKANKPVRYPFGHGLSYTSFEYSNIKLSANEIDESEKVTVTFTVKNTGAVAGAEVAQIYVADKESTIYRPVKELKAFKKIYLESGEEKEVSVTLCRRAFAFYNVKVNDWTVESGAFNILVGSSSADIRLSAELTVNAATVEIPNYSKIAPTYYTADVQSVPDDQFKAVLGREIPPTDRDLSKPITIADNFEYCKHTKKGAKMYKLLDKLVPDGMAKGIALQTPFRDFVSMSGGAFNEVMAEGLVIYLSDKKGGKRKIACQIPKLIKSIGPLMKNI